jgi:hypothetical protein
MAASTFRAQVRAGCKTVLDSVQATNPTLLAHVYDHPPSAPRTPCAWVSKEMRETYQHTTGLRLERLEARIVVLNRLISNDQASDEQDVLRSLVLDAFTSSPRAASSQSMIEPIACEDQVFEFDSASYAGFVLTIAAFYPGPRI